MNALSVPGGILSRPRTSPRAAAAAAGKWSPSLARLDKPCRLVCRAKAEEDEEEGRGGQGLETQEFYEDEVKSKESVLWSLWKSITGNKDEDLEAQVAPGFEDVDINLGDLLDPSLDNLLALVLTGLLGFALLQISWQLLLVAVTIIISGLKYTVLSAFLVAFIIFFL